MRQFFKTFKTTLTSIPNPTDVKSVINNTGAGVAVTAINASVFVVSSLDQISLFILAWWSLTVLLCALTWMKSHVAARKKVTRVTQRAATRLIVSSSFLAIPWAALTIYIIGFDGAGDQLAVLLACAGMSAGGTFMLHRTLLAALVYNGTILASVVFSVHFGGISEAWMITVYALVYWGFLGYFAFDVGQTARERDTSVIALSESVKELEEAEQINYQLANIDTVTGLPNRKAFREQLIDQVQQAGSENREFTVLLLDLDHFKNINDLFGHTVGDELLSVIGQRLKYFAQSKDFVARLGGDEFAVVLWGKSVNDCEPIAEKVINLLTEPTRIVGQHIHPSVSIGAASFPIHAIEPNNLLRNADLALHRAKDQGRGAYVVFDNSLRSRIVESDRIERGLRNALNSKLIKMAYQPKISLKDAKVIGAEALVRWHDPELGNVSPDLFLPIAAERGLLPKLSREIVEQVAKDVVFFRENNAEIGKIAINIHPIELKFPQILMENVQLLSSYGVDAEDLVLEVTEGCFVGRGTETAPKVLAALTDKGYELSLDDFGTGHASLSHLRKLPVAEIKIDRTFVTGICSNSHDRSIVSAIAEIARGMGIRSVAEGVELEEQYEAIAECGVNLGQGYLWSRPLFAKDYVSLIQRGNSDAKSENNIKVSI